MRKSGYAWVSMTLLLASCAAGPKAIMGPGSGKLVEYFEAKNELAAVLAAQLAGGEASDTYHLVSLNGPGYPIGALIPLGNPADLESRDCIVADDDLPDSVPWASIPKWTSSNRVNLEVAFPPIFEEIEESDDAIATGILASRGGYFGMEDMSQVLLSRQDFREIAGQDPCRGAILNSGGETVFVRGIVYGVESLKSSSVVNLGADATIKELDGQIVAGYNSTGAFELTETTPSPKFAIMSILRPETERAASIESQGASIFKTLGASDIAQLNEAFSSSED